MKIQPDGGFRRVHEGWLTPGHAAKFICGLWAVNFQVVEPQVKVTCKSCRRKLGKEAG